MPKVVELPTGQRVEFPDGISEAEMADAIDANFYKKPIAPKSEKYLQMQAEQARLREQDAGSTAAKILEHVEGVTGAIANPIKAILTLPENALRAAGVDFPYTAEAPLITTEQAQKAIEFLTPGGKASEGSLSKAAQEFAAESIAPMTSPEIIGLVAAGTKAPVPVGRYFQGHMLTQVPATVAAMNEADGADKTKAALATVANVAFPALIEKGIGKAEAKTLLVDRAKDVGPATERVVQAVEQPGGDLLAPVEIKPVSAAETAARQSGWTFEGEQYGGMPKEAWEQLPSELRETIKPQLAFTDKRNVQPGRPATTTYVDPNLTAEQIVEVLKAKEAEMTQGDVAFAASKASEETPPASVPLIDKPVDLTTPTEAAQAELGMPVPAKKRPTRAPEDRPPDLIDQLEGQVGGKLSLTKARALIQDFKPTGALRKLFASQGMAPDVAAQGVGFRGSDVEFLEALQAAAEGRKAFRTQRAKESELIRTESKQLEEFTDKAIQGNRPKKEANNVERVPVEALNVGDKFKVQNHEFEVTDLQFEGDTLVSLTVKDGPKFGVQTVTPDVAEFIYVDKATFQPGEQPPAFTPAEGPLPTLRQMEKQGDLLSTQQEPFALAGEKGIDAERIARERAAAEQTRREAERIAAEQQGTFGALVAKPGPGAASPVEFEQRLRTLERPPPDQPPAATIDANLEPSIDVVRKPKDYNIFNRVNSPQAVFGSGNLGANAKAAWEKMALGEFAMREGIARDVETFVNQLTTSLPKEFRKDGGRAFFEVLDGRGIEQIEAEFAGKPQITTAARALKQRLEEIRTSIRDTKRQQYETYLNGLDRAAVEDIYRNTIDEAVPQSKAQAAQALSMTAYPDDWGIADGSYLPHLFFGGWKVTMRRPGADTDSFVTRAKTPEEAKAFIRQAVKNDPELGAARFNVEQDVVIPADMVRLFDAKFFKLVSEMKNRTGLTAGEIREAQQGIIGRKATKQKWFGSLQERKGFAGYEKDFNRVMAAYLSGYHRWRVLSQLQNEVTPLIENVKQEGRPNAAVRLESLMENLWGKPAESSLQFDALIQRVPGLKDWVQPLALDRWTRFVRSLAAIGHLTTLRFSVINRLQPLQGLYPIVGERLMLQAKRLQHTTEGRRLLDQHGVTFDIGQFGEPGMRGKITAVREKFSGERSNQELGFLAMYLHGQERGLPPAEAAQYAKLRGQLMTQFHPLTVDIPQAFEGPVAQTVFQYRRFSVKQLELIGAMAKSKNLSGISRMLAVLALTGGLSYFLRQTYSSGDDKLRLRKNLEDSLGKDGADLVFYGLPGLVNADLSGSLVLGDQPRGNLYETIGRATVGPAVSTGIDLAKTVMTEPREDISDWQKALIAMRKIPALKPLAEGIALLEGDEDVLSPDGETRYRRSVKDTLVGMGAFRSANESTLQTAIEGIVELKKETARLKNRYYVDWQKGDTEAVFKDIEAFNERWPEAAITQSELSDYTRRRSKGASKTDQERIQGKKFRVLAPEAISP